MSGRDRIGPRVAQPAPAAYEETVGPATFRRAGGPEAERPVRRERDPRFLGVLLGLLGLSATVALAAPSPARASAPPAPARDGPTCPTRPAPSGLPSESRPAPAGPNGSPSASPSGYAEANDGNVVILDGTGDVFGGGRDDEGEATTQPTPSVTPSPRPSATVLLAGPRPMGSGVDCARPQPSPSPNGGVETGKPLPRIAAEPGQPVVAATPSKLTGSKVTMTGLRFEGIVDLPTADGTLTALKFSMDQAVTDDVLLRTPGPAGRTTRFATDRLTLSGDVAFYTTRFVGRLPGIKITLAPDLPLPDGIPITSPIPITVTDPAIDLAFLNTDTLTARPQLKLTR